MPSHSGPKILAKENLVLALDAGDANSYPGSGTVWNDVSGNGNNGTLVNGPTFDSGNKGSIVFDGVNDYANMPDIMGGLINYSAEFWFKLNTNPINSEKWLGSQYPGSGRVIFDIWTNNKLRNFISGTAIYGNTLILTDTWYHSVFTRNSLGNATIYLNGVLEASGNISTIAVQPHAFEVGGSTTLPRWLNGTIATTKLYNRDLTAEEIQQNYKQQKTRFN